MVRWTAGQEHPAFRAADARLTEVLLHHVDLDAGFTPADWPADFGADMLRRVTASFADREDAPAMRLLVDGTGIEHSVSSGGPVIRGSSSSLLAWATGRSDGSDLTVEGGVLPIPPFLY